MVERKRYLITNVVYGDVYFKIFIERHLRSILDDTNLGTVRATHDIEYRIFTDAETATKLKEHPQVKRLQSLISNVHISVFQFHDPNDKFGVRYSVLYQAFLESVKYALNPGKRTLKFKNQEGKEVEMTEDRPFDMVTAWVADLVVAREFFPRILKRMDEGHDTVFVLPLRATFESTAQVFTQVNRAFTDYDLFKIGFAHLHPLWIACHWGNPTFSRMPYSILWRTRTGIMARSFSLTPIVFKPSPKLLESTGGIDLDVPGFFENPYWCEDWTDAPVIGVEPLFCHYPPFQTEGCSVGMVKRWAHRLHGRPIHETQRPYMKKRLYYPDQRTVKMGWWQKFKSDVVAWRIR